MNRPLAPGESPAKPASDTIEEMLTVTITVKVEGTPGFSALVSALPVPPPGWYRAPAGVSAIARSPADPVTIKIMVVKSAGFFTVALPIEVL